MWCFDYFQQFKVEIFGWDVCLWYWSFDLMNRCSQTILICWIPQLILKRGGTSSRGSFNHQTLSSWYLYFYPFSFFLFVYFVYWLIVLDESIWLFVCYGWRMWSAKDALTCKNCFWLKQEFFDFSKLGFVIL